MESDYSNSISILISLGFNSYDSQLAVVFTNGDIEKSINWILENNNNNDRAIDKIDTITNSVDKDDNIRPLLRMKSMSPVLKSDISSPTSLLRMKSVSPLLKSQDISSPLSRMKSSELTKLSSPDKLDKNDNLDNNDKLDKSPYSLNRKSAISPRTRTLTLLDITSPTTSSREVENYPIFNNKAPSESYKNIDLLNNLKSMGFDELSCVKSIEVNGNKDIEKNINWLCNLPELNKSNKTNPILDMMTSMNDTDEDWNRNRSKPSKSTVSTKSDRDKFASAANEPPIYLVKDIKKFTPSTLLSPVTPSKNQTIIDRMNLSQAIWFKDFDAVKLYIHLINTPDLRGNTALDLAVLLKYNDVCNFLLTKNADPRIKNSLGWDALQQAAILKSTSLVMDLYINRLVLNCLEWEKKLPTLMSRLEDIPNFYMEIKWEIKSWVPLIGSMVPSDTFKIWKQDRYLRFDSNLRGLMDGGNVEKGLVSFLCSGTSGAKSNVYMVDHVAEQFEDALLQFRNPPYEVISREVKFLCSSDSVTTVFDSSNASFQTRNSLFGGISTEKIGNFECTICDVQGLKYQMKKQTESSPELVFDDYFSDSVSKNNTSKESCMIDKQVNAALWLSRDFPLSREAINLVLDLVSPASADMAKINQIFSLNLPTGFPVKLEIPVLPAVTACVTFVKIELVKDKIEETFFTIPKGFQQRM